MTKNNMKLATTTSDIKRTTTVRHKTSSFYAATAFLILMAELALCQTLMAATFCVAPAGSDHSPGAKGDPRRGGE